MLIFKKIIQLLSPTEIKKAIYLMVVITIMAILDVAGIASILPFISVLSNPGLVESNTILNSIYKNSFIFGIENHDQFLFILGIFSFITLVVSLIFRSFATYMMEFFVRLCEFSISKRLIERYLSQPYQWFLDNHSAELAKNILSEVNRVIGAGLMQIINLISRILIVIFILTLLILINIKLTLIVVTILGAAYIIIYYLVKSRMKKIGKDIFNENRERFLIVSNVFSAIKEVKIGGLEKGYIKKFSGVSKSYAINEASVTVFSQIPRYILEIIAFGGILLIVLYMMSYSNNFSNIVPVITLYAFAGYRLMPSMQQIYNAITILTTVVPSLDKLNNDLNNLKYSSVDNKNYRLISFNTSIDLNNIHYKYPNASKPSLDGISLTIPKNSIVGIAGLTGSGKTTLVDIILGLLLPQKGNLKIDGQTINENNARSWHMSFGYVPQHISLIDDTIAANIALGEKNENINEKELAKVSKISKIDEFIVNELPKKYQTKIGERGVKLSGGQRQRIGIARALYNSPKVLILDEATNALDIRTEDDVIESITNLKNTTVILISHRLNTLKNCDIIFKLDRGKLVNQGKFSEIFNNNDTNQF